LLESSQEARFAGRRRAEVSGWAGKTRRMHDDAKRGRESKGLRQRMDMARPAAGDEAHDTMSVPEMRTILGREVQGYGKREFEQLAGTSLAHPCRPRSRECYRTRQATSTETKPTAAVSGAGTPAWVSVGGIRSTKGAGGGAKGVYHINAADDVTRWQPPRFYCRRRFASAYPLSGRPPCPRARHLLLPLRTYIEGRLLLANHSGPPTYPTSCWY
jgi:hypothetical protein